MVWFQNAKYGFSLTRPFFRASHLYWGAMRRGCERGEDEDGESGSEGHELPDPPAEGSV
jgi:hypothetical protein